MATPKLTSFQLTGADDGPLRGEVRAAAGGPRPAVVICHGFKGFKDWGFFPHLATRLARAGFAAVSFNFSGSGIGPDGERFSEPERFGHMTFAGDLRDLATVVGAVRDGTLVPGVDPPTALGLIGHSRGGGTAVLFAAAKDPAVDALVTWSGIGKGLRWDAKAVRAWRRDGRMDIENMRTGEVLPLYTDLLDELEGDAEGRYDMMRAAAAVEAPWLIVHGKSDEAVPVKEAKQLYKRARGRAELLVIPGASHTFGVQHPWAGATPHFDRALDATVGWFAENLV